MAWSANPAPASRPLSRVLLGLVPPSAGRVLFEGKDIAGFGRERHRQFRQAIQPVYQNPYASLNPRFSVAEIIGEPRCSASASATA